MDKLEYITQNINEEENEMGEFYNIAERVLITIEEGPREILAEGQIKKGISADELCDRVSSGINTNINFYPGRPGAPCYKLAVFVSLNISLHAKGRKHLKCRQAMEKIVQHMQGSCIHKTKAAVFVTDFWDGDAFADWQANLEQIGSTNLFEIYLIAGRTISQIKI